MRFVSFYAVLPDLVIANGQTQSNILNGPAVYSDAVALMLESPSGLTETVTIYVHRDPAITNPADAGWAPLESYITGALANVSVPSAGKARTYTDMIPCGSMMLVASAAVVATRTFKVSKLFTA